ncbi:MAG: hypothetical protein KJ072_06240 [Verrucomicrobia bacterium]|nr:hypothetical protein [Verrucomicrobiota bacterium]
MNCEELGRWIGAAMISIACGWAGNSLSSAEAMKPDAIVMAAEASGLERLAAREVRRYWYVRTGQLLPVVRVDDAAAVPGNAIVIGRGDRPWVGRLLAEGEGKGLLERLAPEGYWLKTMRSKGRSVLLVAGGSDCGTLYGAYRLAEHMGVRYYLHGDVVSDQPMKRSLPVLDEERAPSFALRGIQPFHDFPEGPDWWNRDDYLAVIGQLPKLGMNFIGLHTYPEKGPNAEPTVWIGVPEQVGRDGRVGYSYPASYQNTLRGNWGYRAKRTGDFVFGAAELFERDDYGGEVMWGHMPEPSTAEGFNEVFNRTGELLREAFGWAGAVGVRTWVGPEPPLTVREGGRDGLGGDPGAGDKAVAGVEPENWRERELNALTDRGVIERLYEGIYRRAALAYAPDYYWFWTPETWTWEGTKEEQVKKTLEDLAVAIEVHRRLKPGFELATCGWVLGPQQDRALFDKVLPKEVAVSCINREVGKTPVDRGFADVSGRGKWAIPWLEDDPALTSPQLWAGRMRRDAADALRYGCDGLLGIHWRTRVLGPAVGALAQAAWDQSGWATADAGEVESGGAGAIGGKTAQFGDRAIADTEEDPLYQSVRYGMTGYRLALPRGAYRVTLKFCEPHYQETGKRVFDVRVQGQTMVEGLDIFARVGQDRALDLSVERVEVNTGSLEFEFVARTEFPSLAAIVAESGGLARKINCGGPVYRDYEADAELNGDGATVPAVSDFYEDWAVHEFGERAGRMAGEIFARLDGRVPRASDWIEGPGGIRPDARPWAEVSEQYGFVDEFEGLRPRVEGAGARSRYDYWLSTFKYARAMGRLNCTWGLLTNAMGRVRAVEGETARRLMAAEEVLPLRRQLVRELGEVYEHLLATVSNPGELGTVANWEQHILPDLLEKPGRELEELLGGALSDDAQPAREYAGPKRLVVPTVRTALRSGEPLRLRVVILGEPQPRQAALRWRWLGKRKYQEVALRRVARAVYSAEVPSESFRGGDFEYHVKVVPERGSTLYFPATAPKHNQTVVMLE